MKKSRIFFFFWFIPALSFSQISMDSASLAGVGTHYVMGIDTLVPQSVSQGGAGSGQSWDLSGVTTHLIDTVDIVDASTTPYISNFAGANSCSRTLSFGDTSFAYGTLSSTELRIMGFVTDPLQTGTNFIVSANPPALALVLPYQVGVSFSDTSGGEVKGSGSQIGQALVDSFRYKSTSIRNVVVDGEGILTLGSGTYSCLRQKSIDRTIDSIWIKPIFPPSWTLFASSDNIDSTFSYMSDSLGFMVAEVNYDTSGTISSVRYLGPNPPNVSREGDLQASIKIVPNPSHSDFVIEHSFTGKVDIEVISMNGALIFSTESDNRSIAIQGLSFSPGMYLIRLRELNSGSLATKRLLISR